MLVSSASSEAASEESAAPPSSSAAVPDTIPFHASFSKVTGPPTPSPLLDLTITLTSVRVILTAVVCITAESIAASISYRPPATAYSPQRFTTLALPITKEPFSQNFMANDPEPLVPVSTHALVACNLREALMVSD